MGGGAAGQATAADPASMRRLAAACVLSPTSALPASLGAATHLQVLHLQQHIALGSPHHQPPRCCCPLLPGSECALLHRGMVQLCHCRCHVAVCCLGAERHGQALGRVWGRRRSELTTAGALPRQVNPVGDTAAPPPPSAAREVRPRAASITAGCPGRQRPCCYSGEQYGRLLTSSAPRRSRCPPAAVTGSAADAYTCVKGKCKGTGHQVWPKRLSRSASRSTVSRGSMQSNRCRYPGPCKWIPSASYAVRLAGLRSCPTDGAAGSGPEARRRAIRNAEVGKCRCRGPHLHPTHRTG